ncbi:hypothetical protein MMC26_001832 [Xylographa opegraphella]|nr:hypothetical protein [Xylographa opegraphella]
MSTSNTDADSQKPKQPRTTLPNRDKPLFTGRRPPPRLQQRSDFFTDSLNTSYIPSPSPPKQNARTGVGAKPRQATLNRTSLAAAFKATQGKKEFDRPSSAASSTRPVRQKAQDLAQRSGTEPNPRRDCSDIKTAKPALSRHATRTPSPSPGRPQELLPSPASEASASSPPRGLAEAYQRIQDEEFLAGREDDSVDDPEYEDDIVGVQPRDSHWQRLHDVEGPESPISPHESEGYSPDKGLGNGYMHNSDGDTNMSFLENLGEDTFDRRLTQHDKDEQRLRNVLGSDRQPFKKSRTRDRSGLTVDNLQRQDASSKSGSSSLGSPSVSSKGSDPSLNIPQGWGRKGRGNNTWLSRIAGQNGKFTGDISSSRDLQTLPKLEEKASANPAVDWLAAAAEVPLPSIENDSLQPHKSRGSTPASLTRPSQIQRQSSSDRIRRWEFLDDDFTARSLQISDSPPIRMRNAALDAIREREMHSLERSAVTTNRLGELREQRSLELVRRRSPSASAATGLDGGQENDAVVTGRPTEKKPSYGFLTEEEESAAQNVVPLLEDGNSEPLLDSPVVVTRVSPDHPAQPADIPKPDDSSPADRPRHERVDSRDLLRKLARATSSSPKQSPITSVAREAPTRSAGVSGNDVQEPRGDGVSSEGGPELSEGSHSNHIKPESTNQSSAPSVSAPLIQTTPQQSKSTAYLKTPLVTGAWIDTPLPIGTRGLPMPTPNEFEDEDENHFDVGVDAGLIKRGAESVAQDQISTANLLTSPKPSLAETAPLLPRSALAAIIEKAKSNNNKREEGIENGDDTLILDDSTIQSLEELLASDTEAPTIPAPQPSTSTSPPLDSSHDPPHTSIEDDTQPEQARPDSLPEQEARSYDRITKRLSQVGLSIRDARNGIASLERAVSSAPSRPSPGPTPATDDCVEGGEFHDFIWPCARCGCTGRSGSSEDALVEWRTVRLPVPRLWTWRKEDWRPRLTWLGVATAVAWALVGSEYVAHRLYSPPFYASSMDGYGVDCNAPRPPFVLAKLLWRSPLARPLQSLYFVLGVLVRLLAALFGFGAGVFGHPGESVGEPRQAWVYREAEVGSVGGFDDGLMGADEYL